MLRLSMYILAMARRLFSPLRFYGILWKRGDIMKYRCLVLDHDDTVVDSTASIHHPCFQEFLNLIRPGKKISLEEYFSKNFGQNFLDFCRSEYGFTDEEIEREGRFWKSYAKDRVPKAFPGIGTLLWEQKRRGGLICVVSYSFSENILRDYARNALPKPDRIFGWEEPLERRKPDPYPLFKLSEEFSLSKEDILVVDDAALGMEMARAFGADFAAAGWAHGISSIRDQLRERGCTVLEDVESLCRLQFGA